MIVKRPADERGLTEFEWLKSRHTFSFGDYHSPEHMGFRALRVINDDIVAPGRGFGRHPHRDAEIFSYVIDGELEHRDSMGNGSVITAGNLQYMSAGSGVVHSEFNPSNEEPVHFLQIWLIPNVSGGEPRYAERALTRTARNTLQLLFSGSGRDDSIALRQDAEVSLGRLSNDAALEISIAPDRHAWLHVVRGSVILAGDTLVGGDGIAVSDESRISLRGKSNAEFLWFDLA